MAQRKDNVGKVLKEFIAKGVSLVNRKPNRLIMHVFSNVVIEAIPSGHDRSGSNMR